MGAPPSFLVILFLPPLLPGLCLQPWDVMTSPLHYWLVLSGDHPFAFLCHSLGGLFAHWQLPQVADDLTGGSLCPVYRGVGPSISFNVMACLAIMIVD